MEGILPKTKDILDKISSFESIKPYVMIGGTALSLQMKHRLSEDIDFCRWKKSKNQKLSVDCASIEKELITIGKFEKNVLGFEQIDYKIEGVKITFFCNNLKQPIDLKLIDYKNNIKLADVHSIGVMKLQLMQQRRAFRDYYDIFSIVKSGVDFNTLANDAREFSRHTLRSRDVIFILSNGHLFHDEDSVKHLLPQYNVTAKEIETFLIPYIKQYAELRGKVFPTEKLVALQQGKK